MTFTALEDFGYAIRQARLGKVWSLEELAHEALGNGARKGYVGQIEKGLIGQPLKTNTDLQAGIYQMSLEMLNELLVRTVRSGRADMLFIASFEYQKFTNPSTRTGP